MTTKQARKKKKCQVCGELYLPFRSFQKVCNEIKCALELVARDNEKKVAKELRIARKRTREDKERIKRKSEWIADAQKDCNKYIRLRDKDEPCISCGKYDWEIEDKFSGGKWDAGHFRTRAACPELRFHPLAIHKQCKSCNGGSGKWSKVDARVKETYRENLIKKVGKKIVDWLEDYQHPQNLTIEDIKEIRAYYKEQIKLLEEI